MAAFAKGWRRHYNTIRPHASLRYKPPALEVFVPTFAAWPAALRQPGAPAGHASATASLKLTFHLDHSVGGQSITACSFGGSWTGRPMRPQRRGQTPAHVTNRIREFLYSREASPNRFGQARSAVLEIATSDLTLLVDCEGVAAESATCTNCPRPRVLLGS
jgi:hypothetical protein